MLRFYFKKPDAKVNEMSRASLEAWMACHRVIENLDDRKKAVLQMYFSENWQDKARHIQNVADQNGMTTEEIKQIISMVLRLVAMERGLADG